MTDRPDRSVNRVVAGVFGAVYAVVGLLGFTVSSGHHFVGDSGGELLGLFMVNGLHNVVHLAVGGLLVAAAAAGASAARTVNALVGAIYLVVGLAGLLILGSSLNLIALNAPDNGLHLASAALLLAVGALADRRSGRPAGAAPSRT